MKQIIKKMAFLLSGVLILNASTVFAQTNLLPQTDKIIFLDGVVKEGKVNALIHDKIQFSYKGETLQYEFSKKDIQKIEYASGRNEVFNEKNLEITGLPIIKNKVAVLPIVYIGGDENARMNDMRYRLQEIAINYLGKSATSLTIQDPAETNALLIKAGINDEDIRRYTPAELATVLQSEYIVMGSVFQDNGNLRTVTHESRGKRRMGVYDKPISTRERNTRTIVSNTVQDLSTEVSLSIYTNTGNKIYAKSRHSILSDKDAYKAALHYMLKRTPLYKK